MYSLYKLHMTYAKHAFSPQYNNSSALEKEFFPFLSPSLPPFLLPSLLPFFFLSFYNYLLLIWEDTRGRHTWEAHLRGTRARHMGKVHTRRSKESLQTLLSLHHMASVGKVPLPREPSPQPVQRDMHKAYMQAKHSHTINLKILNMENNKEEIWCQPSAFTCSPTRMYTCMNINTHHTHRLKHVEETHWKGLEETRVSRNSTEYHKNSVWTITVSQ